jgi:amino acid adenylation domain-containing protein
MPTTVENVVENAAGLEALTVPGGSESVLERWASVVAAVGGRPALSSEGTSYTFAEVDVLSDVVAARLKHRLPEADAPVAMVLDHGADAVVALLALMKLGRMAVTLDPHLPSERLRQIVELAGSASCLVDARHTSTVSDLGRSLSDVVRLDELLAEAAAGGAESADVPAPPATTRDDGFCLVFTSGSSGRPKGVVYTHGQALNDAFVGARRYHITPDDRVAQVLPLSFAAGTALLVMALLNGAGVWLYDPRDKGIRGLAGWIADMRMSTFHCTPHLLRSLIAALVPDDVLGTVRLVSTVGEAVYGRDYEALRPHLRPGASFVNWSGSSEIGVLSFHEVRDGDPVPAGVLPAGLPVANRTVRVLNADGTATGPGEAGELVVVSDYLSGGYWNDAEADAARFGVDAEGRRICRQGDLARIDDDGVLHLLGRQDAAVKVRGYLVDPSEVEAAILDAEAVAEAVVVAVTEPSAPTRLVAYVAPDPRVRAESVGATRRRLRAKLPEYMVPSTIVMMPSLPRNERGKVDRQQLPVPRESAVATPPTTQWEIVMGDLWAEILGLGQVGLDDDFMALGGDSLSVEEMLVEVAERFGVALVTSDLVEAPTLREFTRRATLGSAALPSHPLVATLRSGGSGTPLFCFAGGGSLTLSFVPLSRHITDRPVYAFQSQGLERRALPDRSVESAARRALELMRFVQPTGPYLLLGHSFGGLIALEIARRLAEAGERVDLVGLLDTYLPESGNLVPPGMAVGDQPPASGSMRLLGNTTGARVRRVLTEGLPGLDRWKHYARVRLAGVVQFSGQNQYDAFFTHAGRVGSRYRVRPYAGRALLVLAGSNPDGPKRWARYLTGPTRVVDLPAEHGSLVREPYATRIAALLHNEFLETGR